MARRSAQKSGRDHIDNAFIGNPPEGDGKGFRPSRFLISGWRYRDGVGDGDGPHAGSALASEPAVAPDAKNITGSTLITASWKASSCV